MTLKPGEEIGKEVHADRDQFFRVEMGKGEVVIDGQRNSIKRNDAILVPAGARHNVINSGDKPLRTDRNHAVLRQHAFSSDSARRLRRACRCQAPHDNE